MHHPHFNQDYDNLSNQRVYIAVERIDKILRLLKFCWLSFGEKH